MYLLKNFYTANGFNWIIFNFYCSLAKCSASTVFIMISGVLFLNKDVTISKIYKKYVSKLIFAFLFWSIIYAIFVNKNLSLALMFKGHYHMWFIPMIIGLYMSIPIIKLIIKDEKITKYFLLLSLIFAFILPTFNILFNDIVENKNLLKVNENLFNNINLLNPSIIMGYTGYFVLGYYLNKINLNKEKRKLIYMCGLTSLIFTIALQMIVYCKIGQHQHYFDRFMLNMLLMSTSVFTYFKYSNILKIPTVSNLSKYTKYTFGIYLIHPLVIFILNKNGLNTLSFNPIFSVPLIAILVFIISLFITIIFKKTPILNKVV